MITANEIINEALEQRMINEMESRYDWIDRLFNFRRRNESKEKSAIILYLSERLMKEQNQKQEALEREYNAHRMAKKCVEIYGIEAELLLEKMWKSGR